MMGEWTEKKFEELCEVIYRYPNYYGITYVEDGVPEIRGELINPDGSIVVDKQKIRYISKETADKFPKTRLKTDDVVMSVRGTIGKIGIIPEEFEGANMTANLLRISPSTNVVDTGYFKQLLLSTRFQLMLDSITTATTIKTFKVPDLKSLKLKLPSSLNEQQKIAEILSSVDETIEKTEEIIEQTERVKKGLMQELLTKGIGHTEYKDSDLGQIPNSWEVVKLGDILEVSYGRNQRNVETEISDIPILGTGGIIGYSTEALYDKPSVLIGRKGTIDKPQYMDQPFWTIDTLFYTKINEVKAIPKFLYFLFNSINWKAYNEATGVPSLSVRNISRIKVKLPTTEEQKKITNILEEITNKTNQENEKNAKLKKIKQGLMQQLLTGKKRVKIDDSEEVLS